MVVRVNHRMPEHANPLPPRILLDDMEYAHPMVRPRYLAWPRHLAPADPLSTRSALKGRRESPLAALAREAGEAADAIRRG